MRSRSMLLFAAVAAVPAGAVHADITGISVGAGVWKQNPDGYIQNDGDRADVEDGLQIDSETDAFVWADLRHPVPVLPRLKLQYTPVSMSGDGRVTRSFEFQGTSFNVNEDVSSELQLDQMDAIFYWTPWSTLVDLDLGVNVKYVDGYAEVEGQQSGDRERVDFSAPLPLLYARVEARLPGTGLFAGGEGSYLTYDGHRIADVTLRGGYRTDLGAGSLAVEGGWKHQNLRLDDLDDVDADLTIEGPYVGVSARF